MSWPISALQGAEPLLRSTAHPQHRLLTFDHGIPQLLATPEERERLLCVLT